MKKLLITSLLLANILSVCSCSDNNTSYDELAETTTAAEATADPATKEKKVYDYVHGEDGYYNIADEMAEFEMKSQKYGTCWLYAAAASMETAYFKKNGSYISIDPMHLLDLIYLEEKEDGIILNDGIDAKEIGGFQWTVTERLSRGVDKLTLDRSVVLDINDREAIKENVRTRGGVAVGVFDKDDDKKGWFGTYRTINYKNDKDFDHDVTIIGYDDHFPKEYFKEPASEDGAWITYNSNSGPAGFYYISYCSPLNSAYSHSVTDKYGEVLSYDAGNVRYEADKLSYTAGSFSYDAHDLQGRYIKTDDWTTTANVFHMSGKLAAVGTYNDFDRQNIKIQIYDSSFTNVLYSQDAVLDYHGYHTIDLDTPIDVSDFAVVVSYEKGAPVEGESLFHDLLGGYRTVSDSGQSFVLLDDEWKDMTDSDIKKALDIDFEPNNCCIKALFAK
jgi:hypothetical protein